MNFGFIQGASFRGVLHIFFIQICCSCHYCCYGMLALCLVSRYCLICHISIRFYLPHARPRGPGLSAVDYSFICFWLSELADADIRVFADKMEKPTRCGAPPRYSDILQLPSLLLRKLALCLVSLALFNIFTAR